MRVACAGRERDAAGLALAGLGLAAAGADSWWVATTTPFSAQARLAVSAGFLLVFLVAVRTFRQRHLAGAREPAGRGSGKGPSIAPWLLVTALIVALELSAYLAGFRAGRHGFPTVSTMYDVASRSTPVKATVVFLWLALGWGLMRPVRPPGRGDATTKAPRAR